MDGTILVPFRVSLSEEGIVKIAGKPVSHLLVDYNFRVDSVTLKFRMDCTQHSTFDKWIKITDWKNGAVINLQNVKFVFADNPQSIVVVVVDDHTKVEVPDGLTVVLNSLPGPPVKSQS